MNLPFEWKIGLRYLRPRFRYGFISVIASITTLTICLGVASLIIVLSVMNGFQKEIRSYLLSTASHIELSEYASSRWPDTIKQLKIIPNVAAAAPFVSGQALLSQGDTLQHVMIRGIDPVFEKKVLDQGWQVTQGNFEALQSGQFGMALSKALATTLKVKVGDFVMVVVPAGNMTPFGVIPHFKQFKVVSLFRTRVVEYDRAVVAIHLTDAQTLYHLGRSISGIRLRLLNPMQAPQVKTDLLKSSLSSKLKSVTDWTEQHSHYFRAVQIEKRMMLIVLSIMILVAAFGLVSTLYMMVNDKRSDIAILRTLGATPRSIMYIFIIQGMVTGILGTLLGVLLGVMAALHIGKIGQWIEWISGTKLIQGDIYLINYLPCQIQLSDIAVILTLSLTLTFLATLYPSLSAAHTQPSEALRYE
ncbi:MAG: lipoprotein-releasing ABC transporter permease subunit [Neisseriales bacterium]|nr:MAG: lipoprotein-releasing ABC transporter permease subunit [Neisseriales bacterium]